MAPAAHKEQLILAVHGEQRTAEPLWEEKSGRNYLLEMDSFSPLEIMVLNSLTIEKAISFLMRNKLARFLQTGRLRTVKSAAWFTPKEQRFQAVLEDSQKVGLLSEAAVTVQVQREADLPGVHRADHRAVHHLLRVLHRMHPAAARKEFHADAPARRVHRRIPLSYDL